MSKIEIYLDKQFNKEIGTLFTTEIPGSPLRDYSLTRMIEVLTNSYGAPTITDSWDGNFEVMGWGGEA